MKTLSKRALSLLLAAIIIVSAAIPTFASDVAWDAWWSSAESQSGINVFPGSDESERLFSWYSDSESEPRVELYTLNESKKFTGSCTRTYGGSYVNKVAVTGLEADTTYSYRCFSGNYKSTIYTFTTGGGDSKDFSAMYVTDVHITYDENNPDGLKETAYNFNNTIASAKLKNPDISLILSAGDQASEGLESEYRAFSSTPLGRSMSIATAAGNHDRKGVDYKTFKFMPNERKSNYESSYITSDYYFVKGDVLFLVMDSNSGSGMDHHAFIKNAVKENPDVKWRVMMMHHDLYSGRIPHRESENKMLRLLWGPMADEFNIDLVLLGHSHYYTVSNVLCGNKTVAPMTQNGVLTDPNGTVYMVSGSINRPRNDDEDSLGLSDNIGYAYLTQEKIYNIIDFTEDSLTVSSYTVESGEKFNSFTINKTSQQGGHTKAFPNPFNAFVRFVGTVYTMFNNISVYQKLTDKGYDVKFFDVVFPKQ